MERRPINAIHALVEEGALKHEHVRTLHDALVRPIGPYAGISRTDSEWGANEPRESEYKILHAELAKANRPAFSELAEALRNLQKHEARLRDENVLKPDETAVEEEEGKSSLHYKIVREIRDYIAHTEKKH